MAEKSALAGGQPVTVANLNEMLRQAARTNDYEKVKELLSRNADINSSYVRQARSD